MNTLALEENRISNFLYLNRDNKWSDFHWQGLEVRNDGALQLSSLPLLKGEVLKDLKDPDGPAGIVVGPDGSVYLSDPALHRRWWHVTQLGAVPHGFHCLRSTNNLPERHGWNDGDSGISASMTSSTG